MVHMWNFRAYILWYIHSNSMVNKGCSLFLFIDMSKEVGSIYIDYSSHTVVTYM